MKRLDELDHKKQADAEFTGEPYTSKFAGKWIPPEYRARSRDDDTKRETNKRQADAKMYEVDKLTLRWSEFKRMQAEDMLQHVQGKVFPFLIDLNGSESAGKYWLAQVLDEWHEDGRSPQDFLKTLRRQTEISPFSESNFLKKPFLDACQRTGLFSV